MKTSLIASIACLFVATHHTSAGVYLIPVENLHNHQQWMTFELQPQSGRYGRFLGGDFSDGVFGNGLSRVINGISAVITPVDTTPVVTTPVVTTPIVTTPVVTTPVVTTPVDTTPVVTTPVVTTPVDTSQEGTTSLRSRNVVRRSWWWSSTGSPVVTTPVRRRPPVVTTPARRRSTVRRRGQDEQLLENLYRHQRSMNPRLKRNSFLEELAQSYPEICPNGRLDHSFHKPTDRDVLNRFGNYRANLAMNSDYDRPASLWTNRVSPGHYRNLMSANRMGCLEQVW